MLAFYNTQERDTREGVPKAILVSIDPRALTPGDDDALHELTGLAETAGLEVVGRVVQSRSAPDSALFVGRGKVAEIKEECLLHSAGVVVFDSELSPAQVRNLEDELDVRILDRTQLILDIFAQRAQSKEGKVQVELAMLNYALPRLTGKGVELSRLGGGIGTRGPGETKLEVDRRRIRQRILQLQRELKGIKRQRQTRRDMRWPRITLVGYTNAGKSTLLNLLTGAGALAEDKLFATLDPLTRVLTLPSGQRVMVSDTVGLIDRLPHQLVAAFRATLEEVQHADLILKVVDVGDYHLEQHVKTVDQLLAELEVAYKPVITVLNKCDAAPVDLVRACRERLSPAVAISALEGRGMDDLLSAVDLALAETRERMSLHLPYAQTGLLDRIDREGKLIAVEYKPDGIDVEAEVPRVLSSQIKNYARVDDDD